MTQIAKPMRICVYTRQVKVALSTMEALITTGCSFHYDPLPFGVHGLSVKNEPVPVAIALKTCRSECPPDPPTEDE